MKKETFYTCKCKCWRFAGKNLSTHVLGLSLNIKCICIFNANLIPHEIFLSLASSLFLAPMVPFFYPLLPKVHLHSHLASILTGWGGEKMKEQKLLHPGLMDAWEKQTRHMWANTHSYTSDKTSPWAKIKRLLSSNWCSRKRFGEKSKSSNEKRKNKKCPTHLWRWSREEGFPWRGRNCKLMGER